MMCRLLLAVALIAGIGTSWADDPNEQAARLGDVSLKDASLERACRVLAEIYDVDVVAEPGVEGVKITMDLRQAPISGVLATLDVAYKIKSQRLIMATDPDEEVNPRTVADALEALKKIEAAGVYVEGLVKDSSISFAKGPSLAAPQPGESRDDGKVYREVYYLYTSGSKPAASGGPQKSTGRNGTPGAPGVGQAGVSPVSKQVAGAGGPHDRGAPFLRWFQSQPFDLKVTLLGDLLATALDDPESGGELEVDVPRNDGRLKLRIKTNPD